MGKEKVKSLTEREAKFKAERKAELKRWLRRPMWPDHKLVEAEPISSPFLNDEESWAEWQQKFFAERREAVRVKLRWSKKRLASFQKLFVDYQRSSSVTTYLKIRRTFPETDIFVPRFLNMSFS